MNKAELVARVAQRSGQPVEQTSKLVELLFDVIQDTLRGGEAVQVAGFGSFRRRYRAERQVPDPRTGEVREVAGRFVPAFVPSDRLRRTVAFRREPEATTGQGVATEDSSEMGETRGPSEERRQSVTDRLSRKVGVHLYLPQSVVVGELFVSEPSLIDFLEVTGACLYVHNAVAFPYLEGSPPARTREAAVRKDDVLFIVARGEVAAGMRNDAVTEVQVMCGPFAIRGKSALPWASLIRELSNPEQRFIPLWQVTVHGPSRASFSEVSILLGLRQLALLGT